MDKEVGKVEPPVIEITEVADSKETSLEAAALETGTVESTGRLLYWGVCINYIY